ncbi:dnaJ homolog subfamily C member 1 [Arapaima gigas]
MASSWGLLLIAFLCVMVARPAPTSAWDMDLELFDLVEEIPQTFYQFLSVEQDASAADIRKAYRRLSLTLHPDKNKDENAETQFRQLVAIYEVLKDEERRQRYDDILVNGLPDWRQPVYYYRRVRKMSNAELGFLLFLILTVGHYAVIWSIYLEKQLDDLLSRKRREKRKKTSSKSAEELKLMGQENMQRSSEKPHWQDILPLKMGIWLYLSVKSLPHLIQDVKRYYEDYKEMKIKEKEEAEALAEQEALQKEKRPKVKKPKPTFPAYEPSATDGAFVPSYDQGASIEEIEEQMDDWLEDRKGQKKKVGHICPILSTFTPVLTDKIPLSHLQHFKHQRGLDCSLPPLVTFFSTGLIKFSELKSSAQCGKGLRSSALPDSIITHREEEWVEETAESGGDDAEGRTRRRRTNRTAVDKPKSRRQRDFDPDAAAEDSGDERKPSRDKVPVADEMWTQSQQKLLETALQQYPRGTAERWDKIAKMVPSKTKEECMVRYKLLAELVQKRKQAKS